VARGGRGSGDGRGRGRGRPSTRAIADMTDSGMKFRIVGCQMNVKDTVCEGRIKEHVLQSLQRCT
jgi:hypothetical protein